MNCVFQSGIDITKILSAKKKLEAKRKRHEKKEAKKAKKDAKKNAQDMVSSRTAGPEADFILPSRQMHQNFLLFFFFCCSICDHLVDLV